MPSYDYADPGTNRADYEQMTWVNAEGLREHRFVHRADVAAVQAVERARIAAAIRDARLSHDIWNRAMDEAARIAETAPTD